MRNFRVKCVKTPCNDNMVDSHVTGGKFYTVTDVAQCNGVEFFTMLGDLKTMVERPSHYFVRFRKGN